MTTPDPPATDLTDAELAALHVEVSAALDRRDHSELNVIGGGEVSIALGCPTERPRVVCKRLAPMSTAELDSYRELIHHYIDGLAAIGVEVVPTELRAVEQGDRHVAYVVQPLVPTDSLGHHVLGRCEPDADHPVLVALADTITRATDRLSVDAQVTNWSWDGSALTLLDVGTPFMWDESGVLLFDLDSLSAMLPAVVRRSTKKDITALFARWKQPRGVALDVVANLYREGLSDWVEPTIERMNATLDHEDPIRADEARSVFEQDKRTFPRLKKMQQLERVWCTKVRRRRYEFFVSESTYL